MTLRISRTLPLLALLLAAFATLPAFAQGRRGGVMNRRPPARPERPARAEKPLQQLQHMSPEQRQKTLQHLPPERRQALEEKLKRYDQLPPAERERLGNQLDRFQTLPPERQQAVRKAAANVQKLPPDRQAAVRDELHGLAGMDDAARQSHLNSDEFQKKFNRHEQKLIEELRDVVPE